jgi:hypothetical protein
MKTLFLVLLPIIILAQNNLPDTVVIHDGRSFPCLITGVGEQEVRLSLPGRNNEPVIINALKKLTVDSFGIVLSSGKWTDVDKDKLKEFVDTRFIKFTEQNKLDEELTRQSMQVFEEPLNVLKTGSKDFSRWSFGVLYVPYFSGTVYNIIKNTYNEPIFSSYSESRTDLEAQLAYAVTPGFKIIFNAGYSSAYSETRSEHHYRTANTETDYGSTEIKGLKLLDFSLGIKYYFKDIVPGKVSFYASAGAGKQLAFARDEYEQLFIDPVPGNINTDNAEEFAEEINSPWHMNLGFGAEYFFNESLSLTSDIRLLYTTVSGEYQSRSINEFQTSSRILETTRRDFITKIGIGFNFYF